MNPKEIEITDQEVLLGSDSDRVTVARKNERWFIRTFLQICMPLLHLLLSVGLSLFLLLRIDSSIVAPESENRKSYLDIFRGNTILRASDVTTFVSAVLVVIRLTTQSYMISAVWKCAMILLQHDGLSLDQLDTMISYRIPMTFSGTKSWPIALVLIAMLPSGFIAPLVSGSVDWVPTTIRNETSVPAGFGAVHRTPSFWFQFNQNSRARQEIIYNALGNSALTWFDKEAGKTHWGRSRLVVLEGASQEPKAKIYDIPMPFIEIHNITWAKHWNEKAKNALFDQSKHRYTGTEGWSYITANAILFDPDQLDFPDGARDNSTILTETRYIGVLLGGGTGGVGEDGHDCKWSAEMKRWDDLDQMTLVNATYGTCWGLGTVSYTTGIKYVAQGTYVTNRTVEAETPTEPGKIEKVIGDSWDLYALYLLSEMMSALPGARTRDVAKGNLTEYIEELIRESYISVRSTLFPFIPLAANEQQLKVEILIPVLGAKVDKIKVLSWLILTLLLPASGLIIIWIEWSQKGVKRSPVVSTALTPLLTDVREVLVQDENGLSNMTYITKHDTKALQKLKLRTIKVPQGEVFGLTANN